jgi:hypothetical protein
MTKFPTVANLHNRFPHPTGGNSTVISPSPTYTDNPFNTGNKVGADKSSIAAIVVALAFAHVA